MNVSSSQFNQIDSHRPEWLESIIDDIQLPYADTQTHDAIIFIVDCSESMRGSWIDQSTTDKHDRKNHNTILFNVLGMIENAVKNKMLSAPDDCISIILFGSQQHSTSTTNMRGMHNNTNMYVVNELNQPNTELIKQLQLLQNTDYFDETVGSSTTLQLDRVLWYCSLLYNDKYKPLKYSSKRIFIITNNDYPLDSKDKSSRNRCLQKARDLRENNISIQCIPIIQSTANQNNTHEFNPHRLIFKIENNADGDSNELSPEDRLQSFQLRTQQSLTDLNTTITHKLYKKRSLGTIELSIATDISISVNVYSLIHEQKKQSPVLLNKSTNQPLQTDTRYVDKYTGEYVDQQQMRKYIDYAGEKIYFTDDELNSIKSLGEVGLTLMGFKPQHTLLDEYNIRSTYFIYPTDTLINGSMLLFHTLLQSMNELQKIAICRFRYRKNSIPRFVALLPQLEQLDEYNNQLLPPGLHMIFLPYSDDIRTINVNSQFIASDQQIRTCKTVIDRLTNIHELPLINNPILIRYNNIIQAIALDQNVDDVIEIVDESIPDVQGMIQKHGPVIERFKHSVYGDSDGTTRTVKSTNKRSKREMDTTDDHNPHHNKHESNNHDDDRTVYESIDWPSELSNDILSKRTVPILKLYCKYNHLPITGKKSDILERITKHITN